MLDIRGRIFVTSILVLIGCLSAGSCNDSIFGREDSGALSGRVASQLARAISVSLASTEIENSEAVIALGLTGSAIPYAPGPNGDTLRNGLEQRSVFVWDTASGSYIVDNARAAPDGEVRFVLYDGDTSQGPDVPLIEIGWTAVQIEGEDREVSVFVNDSLSVELRASGVFPSSVHQMEDAKGVLGRLPRQISAGGRFLSQTTSLPFTYRDSIDVTSGGGLTAVIDHRELRTQVPGLGMIQVWSETHSSVDLFDADGFAEIEIALADSTIIQMKLLGHRASLWRLQEVTIDDHPLGWFDCNPPDVNGCSGFMLGSRVIHLDGAVLGELEEAAAQAIAFITEAAYARSSPFELLLAPALLVLAIED